MSEIINKLNIISDIKSDIATSIAEKGVDIQTTTPFNEYPDLIRSISGSSGADFSLEKTYADGGIPYELENGWVVIENMSLQSYVSPSQIKMYNKDGEYLGKASNETDTEYLSNIIYVNKRLFWGYKFTIKEFIVNNNSYQFKTLISDVTGTNIAFLNNRILWKDLNDNTTIRGYNIINNTEEFFTFINDSGGNSVSVIVSYISNLVGQSTNGLHKFGEVYIKHNTDRYNAIFNMIDFNNQRCGYVKFSGLSSSVTQRPMIVVGNNLNKCVISNIFDDDLVLYEVDFESLSVSTPYRNYTGGLRFYGFHKNGNTITFFDFTKLNGYNSVNGLSDGMPFIFRYIGDETYAISIIDNKILKYNNTTQFFERVGNVVPEIDTLRELNMSVTPDSSILDKTQNIVSVKGFISDGDKLECVYKLHPYYQASFDNLYNVFEKYYELSGISLINNGIGNTGIHYCTKAYESTFYGRTFIHNNILCFEKVKTDVFKDIAHAMDTGIIPTFSNISTIAQKVVENMPSSGGGLVPYLSRVSYLNECDTYNYDTFYFGSNGFPRDLDFGSIGFLHHKVYYFNGYFNAQGRYSFRAPNGYNYDMFNPSSTTIYCTITIISQDISHDIYINVPYVQLS